MVEISTNSNGMLGMEAMGRPSASLKSLCWKKRMLSTNILERAPQSRVPNLGQWRMEKLSSEYRGPEVRLWVKCCPFKIHLLRTGVCSRRDGSAAVRALGLPENQNLVPMTCARQCKTAYNSSSWVLDASGLHGHLRSRAHTHMQTNTPTHNLK